MSQVTREIFSADAAYAVKDTYSEQYAAPPRQIDQILNSENAREWEFSCTIVIEPRLISSQRRNLWPIHEDAV